MAAPYGTLLPLAVKAAVEAMVTIEPRPPAFITGSAYLQTWNVPPTCTSSIRLKRAASHSATGPNSA
ncbi:MAG: hypothetical protein R2710_05960 [Acidimicrobiales bacterium]